LRETLIAARAGASPLARAVYGTAADAALRARDWGEFLKSASHLVDLEEAGIAGRGEEGGAVAAKPRKPPPQSSAWGSDEEGEGAGQQAGPPLPAPPPPPPLPWRPGEALAALVLYFAAASPTPQCLDAARLLRKAMGERRGDASDVSASSPDLAFALSVHAAIRAGDALKLCELVGGRAPSAPPPPRWRAAILCEAALGRARRAGLGALASAYRTLPASVVVERLGLPGDDEASTHAALAELLKAEIGEEGEDGKGGEKKAPRPPPPAWAVRALPGAGVGGVIVFKG